MHPLLEEVGSCNPHTVCAFDLELFFMVWLSPLASTKDNLISLLKAFACLHVTMPLHKAGSIKKGFHRFAVE